MERVLSHWHGVVLGWLAPSTTRPEREPAAQILAPVRRRIAEKRDESLRLGSLIAATLRLIPNNNFQTQD